MEQLVGNIVVASAQLLLYASGLYLSYKVTPILSFSHLIPFTLTPYLVLLFSRITPGSTLLAYAASVLCGGCSMYVIETCINRSLRKRHAPDFAYLLTSFATCIVLINVVAMISGDDARVLSDGAVISGVPILGARITHVQLETILAALIAAVSIQIVAEISSAGAVFRAVSSNAGLARCVGIRVDRVRALCWSLSGCLAGLSGLLVGLDTALTPGFGFPMLFLGVVALVIGGRQSYSGTILGVLVVTCAQQATTHFLGGRWYEVVVFVLFVLALFFSPKGLLASKGNRGQ